MTLRLISKEQKTDKVTRYNIKIFFIAHKSKDTFIFNFRKLLYYFVVIALLFLIRFTLNNNK